MTTRREFLRYGAALVGASFLPAGSGCLQNEPNTYAVTVKSLADQSVYEATAREHDLLVNIHGNWRNPNLNGLHKVVAIDGVQSDSWIFEIDGRRYDGNLDAAEATIVRAGQVVTWRQI